MIKFVIVEDDKETVRKVEEVIKNTLFDKDIIYDKAKFNKYNKDLYDEIKDYSMIKIYILDIELENSISGIDIAKKIREHDWESNIIFITTHDKMFESVFRKIYNVFDFIEKFDNMENRLEKDILEIAKHNFDYKTFKYSTNNVDIQIYYKLINYFTRDPKERKIIINTDTNEFLINSSIKDLENKLDSRFIKVSRSTLVNKENISEINWNKGFFVLNNGNIKYLVTKNFNKGEIK